MGDKTKNFIIESMKSEEMRDFLRDILQEQTGEIIQAFNSVDENRIQGDIEKLQSQLSQEMQTRNELENSNSDLILQNEKLQTLFNEKENIVEELNRRLAEQEKKVAGLESQNGQLEKLLEEKKERLEQSLLAWEAEKTAMSDKLDSYEERYSRINVLYEEYKKLPISVKQRISNIFANGNVYSLVVAASDWNSIEGLWGFTKRRIIEEDEEGLTELINVFTESFYLYSTMDGTGRYELITPNIGDHFDSDLHGIKGVKTDGVIEKVLLAGIYDSVARKTIFKALVQIQ